MAQIENDIVRNKDALNDVLTNKQKAQGEFNKAKT